MFALLGVPLSPWQVLQTSNLAPNSRCMLGSGTLSAALARPASATTTARAPNTICVRMNFLPHQGVVGETIAHETGRRGVLRQAAPSDLSPSSLLRNRCSLLPGPDSRPMFPKAAR